MNARAATSEALVSCFAAVTHTPERRARLEAEGLAERLSRIDTHAFELGSMPSAAPFPAGLVAELKSRHEQVTRAYWSSVGRTMSSVVVGPARFPEARNAKRRAIADRRAEEVREDLSRALRRLEGAAFPFGLPGSPIRADDPQAIEKLRAKIEDVRAAWAFSKQLSGLYRKGDWSAIGRLITPRALQDAMRSHFAGFNPFSLTSYGPEIKRLEARIAQIEVRRERETVEHDAVAGVVMIENAEAGRVQLQFPAKPDDATRALLRSRGFVFSPTQGAWQRGLNNAGICAAQQVLASLKAHA